MRRIPIIHLRQRTDRPPGYVDMVLAAGQVVGDSVELTEEAFAALQASYSSPTLRSRAASFGRSLLRWARAGFPIAGSVRYAYRRSVCALCPKWTGRQCLICGCATAIKLRMTSERCPLGRW